MLQAAVEVIEDPGSVAAALDPTRRRMLEALKEPDSAAGLARRIGQPRQRLNYHLRELEAAGLVEFIEERRRGNCMERLYRSTARSYVVAPVVLGPRPVDEGDCLSAAHLVATAAGLIRDVAALARRAARARRRLATATLTAEVRLSKPSDIEAFAREAAEALAAVAARFDRPDGRRFSMFTGIYPTVTKSDDDAGDLPARLG